MALDTPDKRASAIHVSLPFRRSIPFPPDTLVDQNEWPILVYLYSGIPAAVAVALITPNCRITEPEPLNDTGQFHDNTYRVKCG